jgi:hypothetical protein
MKLLHSFRHFYPLPIDEGMVGAPTINGWREMRIKTGPSVQALLPDRRRCPDGKAGMTALRLAEL